MILLLVDSLCCYYPQCVVSLIVLLSEETLCCRLNRMLLSVLKVLHLKKPEIFGLIDVDQVVCRF